MATVVSLKVMEPVKASAAAIATKEKSVGLFVQLRIVVTMFLLVCDCQEEVAEIKISATSLLSFQLTPPDAAFLMEKVELWIAVTTLRSNLVWRVLVPVLRLFPEITLAKNALELNSHSQHQCKVASNIKTPIESTSGMKGKALCKSSKRICCNNKKPSKTRPTS